MKKQAFETSETMRYVSPCARMIEISAQQNMLASSFESDSLPDYSETEDYGI